MNHLVDDRYENSVAIIGLACRFPGSPDVNSFWTNLCDGVECIKHYSEQELRQAGVSQSLLDNPNYVRANPEIDDYDQFDASFFGMTSTIAQITDPQQRVFLECAWQALESSGYCADSYQGDIGVYAGLSINTYLLQNYSVNREVIDSIGEFQAAVANRGDHLATLTCYKLNLTGPGVTVQSTCSTSLTSVHMGAQCLLDYQSDMIIAGGVSIRVPHRSGYMYQQGGVASPDGHCRPFDSQANGTVFGSGVGAVVLKRMSDAIADNDNILAVIKGSAINNDGSQKIGYTAPSIEGQQRVITTALANADVHPETISYVETHGTGTTLGDPVEIEALTKAFRSATDKNKYCAIGSVKSNIGHLDTASGIAGLIKTVLALSHKQIPPSLHFNSPNPKINFDVTPFFVNTQLQQWHCENGPRRAGVSSFGVGGTNVHMVLEEHSQPQPSDDNVPWHIFPLSTKTATALEETTGQLKDYFKHTQPHNMGDIAYTLQMGRKAFDYRRVIIGGHSLEDISNTLDIMPQHRVYTSHQQQEKRSIVFMFPAMGSHEPDFAIDLYKHIPEFSLQLDKCLEQLEPELGFKIKQVFLQRCTEQSTIDYSDPTIIEPLIFAVEYSLAQTWIKWGVKPQALMGDGIGEYVAAAIAGVLNLSEIGRLLAVRCKCLNLLPPGSMLIVHQSKDKLLQSLAAYPGVEYAGINRESRCIVSGPVDLIEAYSKHLDDKNIVCQRLHFDRALNCSGVDKIKTDFTIQTNTINYRRPTIPIVSGLSGDWVTDQDFGQDYWWRQMREPRRISDAMSELLENRQNILLEVGPGSTLMNIARLHPNQDTEHTVLGSLFRPDSDCSESRAMMTTLGRLWLAGIAINWQSLHQGKIYRRVALPAYPFERKRYWLDPPAIDDQAELSLPRQADLKNWFYIPSWKQTMIHTAQANENEAKQNHEKILLFSDAGSLSKVLTKKLIKLGCEVTQVLCADDIQSMSSSTILMNSKSVEEYDALFNKLTKSKTLPDTIIYAWTLTPRLNEDFDQATDPSLFLNEFWSLVALCKALGKYCHNKAIQLMVVVNELHSVSGEENVDPIKSAILGPCKVISQECTNISCQCVDIVVPQPGGVEENILATKLVSEIMSADTASLVAYRAGRRWLRSYEPLQIEAAEPQQGRIRKQGVYLITGGLGGMGLVLAKHLAKTAQARLVLISRSAPMSESSKYLSETDHQQLTRFPQIAQDIKILAELGSQVMIMRADVADQQDMENVIDTVFERFGELNGVIHAAGVAGKNIMQLMSQESATNVFQSKVKGTMVLDSVLTRMKQVNALDFLLLCGSRTVILGGYGQADYISANAFLDSFAEYKQLRTCNNVFTIDWCGLREVGMLADAAIGASVNNAAYINIDDQQVKEIKHPLLHRQVYESEEIRIYETDFAVDTHWVLSDHRISGVPIVPGTTYLEMVRAAFDDLLVDHELEISDVFFLTPLRVRVGERRTTTLKLEKSDDGYQFLVQSRQNKVDSDNSPILKHVVGKVKVVDTIPVLAVDLDEIVARCDNLTEIFTDEDAVIDDHGPRWQNVKKVYHGDNEMFTVMELSDEFIDDLKSCKIHPSLLDKSIGTGRGFDLGNVPMMPYSYNRLRFKHPFTQSISVYTRSHGVESNLSETPAFDVTIFDSKGNTLAEIDRFCLKRVNDVGQMYRNFAESEQAESGEELTYSSAEPSTLAKEDVYRKLMDEEGISAEELCSVFDRIIGCSEVAQLIVSTRDLGELIKKGMIHTRPIELENDPQQQDKKLITPTVLHPRPNLSVEYQAPNGSVQTKIASIWQNILGIEKIGVDDNFFELGGDSVISIRIAGALKDEFDIEVPVVQLFEAPTIKALAGFFAANEADTSDIDAVEKASKTLSRGARRRNKIKQRGLRG